MPMRNDTSEIVSQLVRAAPAAAGAVATAITLSEWVAIGTLAYIVVQMAYLVWKASWERQERIEARDRERRKEAREDMAAAEARTAAAECRPSACPAANRAYGVMK